MSKKGETINLTEIIEKYGAHWKWLALGVFVSLASAFLYLKYTTYQYKATSVILINSEDSGNSTLSERSVFGDLGLFMGPKTSLDTEMGVFKSRTLMEKVVKELNLQVTYFEKKGPSTREIYKNDSPLKVSLLIDDSIKKYIDTSFSIKSKTNNNIELFNKDGNLVSQASLGEIITTSIGDILITPSNANAEIAGREIYVKITPLEDIAISYKNRIIVTQENIKSNLLTLTLDDPVPNKAKDILDNLVQFYNQDALDYKRLIANTTDEFINNRIDDISSELTALDLGVESYKNSNRFSDEGFEKDLILSSNVQVGNQIVELTSQIQLIDYITDYVNSNQEQLIPANLGLVNEITNQNMANYNRLLLERNRLLPGANKMNPVIIDLNDQINRLRESIKQSLINSKSSLSISLNQLQQQEGKLMSKISSAPKKEREIRDIKRQQEIIETLYLYLLQKREENSISLAVTAPNAKVVDLAYVSKHPISPKSSITYLSAGLLGFLIPTLILFMLSLFDKKIHTIDEIEAEIKSPIIGQIPKAKNGKKIMIFNDDNKQVGESFRLLRTNIDFMLSKTQTTSKIIYITSTIRGEGKTYTAINLASSFALLNKKVLLLGADLRLPQIASYLKTTTTKGLSNFLTDRNMTMTEIISRYDKSNIDIITAGAIPPNPSELFTNGRFDAVLDYAKEHYDYIIVDTSPVHVVTDTLLIAHHADLFLYIVRANFLDKRLLKIPKKLHKNKRLPNMTILLNGTKLKSKEANYGYST